MSVTQMKDGSLLVKDDFAGATYRISYDAFLDFLSAENINHGESRNHVTSLVKHGRHD